MGSVISKILDEEREYRPLFKPSNKESLIRWKTGDPKKEGKYIITTKDGVGCIYFDPKDVYDLGFLKQFIIAWCKLSDIEPYKEETE